MEGFTLMCHNSLLQIGYFMEHHVIAQLLE